jgi:hypothetical protein
MNLQLENKKFIAEYIDAGSGKPKTEEQALKFISESDIELLNHIVAFERSFPLYEVIIDDMLAEDDKVAVRMTLNIKGGEHAFMGISVEGKKASIQGYIIYQILNRKIINHWFLSDNLSLMQQLGAIPIQSEADEKRDVSMTHMNVITSIKKDS